MILVIQLDSSMKTDIQPVAWIYITGEVKSYLLPRAGLGCPPSPAPARPPEVPTPASSDHFQACLPVLSSPDLKGFLRWGIRAYLGVLFSARGNGLPTERSREILIQKTNRSEQMFASLSGATLNCIKSLALPQKSHRERCDPWLWNFILKEWSLW